MTSAVTLAQIASNVSTQAFKNRVINGDMRIDQRNLGASQTPAAGINYFLDRWQLNLAQSSKLSIQRNAGSVTPPVGFTNYLGLTSLSAYSIVASDFHTLRQVIEGFNVTDLAYGTADAKTITLSFWVRSSLTGTFGGCLNNASFTRGYPYTYTISNPNVWEYKTVTIPGDTTGTWPTDNTGGLLLGWTLGTGSTYTSGTTNSWNGITGGGFAPLAATGVTSVVGTNGATFYITGVQVEIGTAASSFDYRPYALELTLCQRYFYRVYGIFWSLGIINQASGSWTLASMSHPTAMRTNPTFGHNLTDANRVTASPTANQWSVYNQNVGWGSISFSPASTFQGIFNGSGSTVQGHAGGYYTTFSAGSTHIGLGSNLYIEWSAEL